MTRDYNALTLIHRFLSEHIKPGDFCIDATAGRGRDTVFLCGLTGDTGKVLAFDIQPEAVESTKALVEQKGYSSFCRVIKQSHSVMGEHAQPGTVDCITFNFGWLPGGDHTVFTKPQTSIAAINAGLALLRPGGLMTLCIYYGRETGFEERDALLRFLPTIDSTRYTVLEAYFSNRPNNPPIPVFITRDI